MSEKKPKTVKAKIISDTSGPMDLIALVLSSAEIFLEDADQLTDGELVVEISNQAIQTTNLLQSVISKSAEALVCAWTCGRLLNTAKVRCGHGNFETWRSKNLDEEIIGERTSQRYMKIANTFPDVKTLLKKNSNLTQAYLPCGTDAPETKGADIGDLEETKKKALFSSVTGILKKLSQFADLKRQLGDTEKHHLISEKARIDELFSKILATQ